MEETTITPSLASPEAAEQPEEVAMWANLRTMQLRDQV